MPLRSKYNDTAFFLVFIAFVSAFNYYLTYHDIKFNGFLFLTYAVDTIQGWIAWQVLKKIIVFLDARMPYEVNPAKRIIVQLVLTLICCLLTITLLTELASWIIMGRSARMNFYSFDLFIIVIWFIVLNLIYVGMHYYKEFSQSETRRKEESKTKAEGFYVKQGKLDLQLRFDEIVAFYSDNGLTYVQVKNDRKFVTEKSLDRVEQIIPRDLFFRLNRKFIIHHAAVTGFKRVEDGKLEVLINVNAQTTSMPVSRIRAASFKKWFQE